MRALDGAFGSYPPYLDVVVCATDAGDSAFYGSASRAGDLVATARFIAHSASPLNGTVLSYEEEVEKVPFFLVAPCHCCGAFAGGFGGDFEGGLPVVHAAFVPGHGGVGVGFRSERGNAVCVERGMRMEVLQKSCL